MPFEQKTWGTTVPIDPNNYADIYFDTEVFQGAHLGVKYVQTVQSPTDNNVLLLHYSLLALDLAAIATAINSNLGALAEYITLSWNYEIGEIAGYPVAKITDLQLGIVMAPQSNAVSASNVLQALRTVTPFNTILNGTRANGTFGQWSMLPSQYQLGVPNNGTGMFHYRLTQAVYTGKRIDPQTIANSGTTIDAIKENIRVTILSNLISEFTRIANENDCNFYNCTIDCTVIHSVNTQGIAITATWLINYDSDKPIQFSPSTSAGAQPLLTGIEITLLGYIAKIVATTIIAIVVAYFAIQAIKDWLISMTTKTTTHEVCYYDPVTGNLIKCEKITEQSPSWEGIIAVFIGFTVVVMGYTWIRGGRKKK